MGLRKEKLTWGGLVWFPPFLYLKNLVAQAREPGNIAIWRCSTQVVSTQTQKAGAKNWVEVSQCLLLSESQIG